MCTAGGGRGASFAVGEITPSFDCSLVFENACKRTIGALWPRSDYGRISLEVMLNESWPAEKGTI